MYTMARFPTRDAEVERLAKDVCAGLKVHPELCAGSPVTPDQLEQAIVAFDGSRHRTLKAAAKAAKATAEHGRNRKALVDSLKREIRHLENVAGNDPA